MNIITLLWWSLGHGNRVVPSRWQATLAPQCARQPHPANDPVPTATARITMDARQQSAAQATAESAISAHVCAHQAAQMDLYTRNPDLT